VGELKATQQHSFLGFHMNRTITLAIITTMALCVFLSSSQLVKAEPVDPIYFSDGVTVFCPVNATYNCSPNVFNYTFGVGFAVRYQLNYTLDGIYSGPMPYTIINPEETHVTYLSTGNVSLPTLSAGQHFLTVSLRADFGLGKIRYYNDTIYFTVNTTTTSRPTASPTPTAPPQNSFVFEGFAVAAVVFFGVLAYLCFSIVKRHKTNPKMLTKKESAQ
jgi:hypothetical protein